MDVLKNLELESKRYIKINIPGKIDNMKIPLDGVNFITGYNDVGKTYVLKSIYTALRCLEFTVRFSNTRGIELRKITSPEEIRDRDLIEFYKKNNHNYESISKLIDAFIANINLSYTNIIARAILGTKDYELEIVDKYKAFEFAIGNGYAVIPKSDDINFAFMSSNKVLEYSNILFGLASKSSSVGINNPMAVPDYDKDLIEKLNKVYIDFAGKTPLKFDKEGNCEIQHNDKYVKVSEVGDGLRVKAVIDTLINNKTISNESVILLDEPDNGLHTSVYNDVLQKIFCSGTVFLTTHNATFINASTLFNKPTRYYYCEEQNGIINLKEVTAYEASRVLNTVLVEDEGVY